MKRKTLSELRNMTKPQLVDYADRLSGLNAALDKEVGETNERNAALREHANTQRALVEELEDAVEQATAELQKTKERLGELEKAYQLAHAGRMELATRADALQRTLLLAIHMRPLGDATEANG